MAMATDLAPTSCGLRHQRFSVCGFNFSVCETCIWRTDRPWYPGQLGRGFFNRGHDGVSPPVSPMPDRIQSPDLLGQAVRNLDFGLVKLGVGRSSSVAPLFSPFCSVRCQTCSTPKRLLVRQGHWAMSLLCAPCGIECLGLPGARACLWKARGCIGLQAGSSRTRNRATCLPGINHRALRPVLVRIPSGPVPFVAWRSRGEREGSSLQLGARPCMETRQRHGANSREAMPCFKGLLISKGFQTRRGKTSPIDSNGTNHLPTGAGFLSIRSSETRH